MLRIPTKRASPEWFTVHAPSALLQSQSPRFFKVPKSTAGLSTFPNLDLKVKQTRMVPVSVRCGGDSIISGNEHNTGLGGRGGGAGAGAGGETEGEERFDRIKVVPMLGSPEMARELESLLKLLGGYELIVKWLIFRRLKLQKGVFKDRWLADDYIFLAQLLIGYGLWFFGKVMAGVAVSRLSCYLPAPTAVSLSLPIGVNAGILNACPDNSFQVMGIVADIMLSFIPAPTSLSLRPPIGVDAGSIAQILLVCFQTVYQAQAIIANVNPPKPPNGFDAGSITEIMPPLS